MISLTMFGGNEDVDSLIYLSWRPDESSVFRMSRDRDLFERVYKLDYM